MHAVAIPPLLADQVFHLAAGDERLLFSWAPDIDRLPVTDALVVPAALLPHLRRLHPGALESGLVMAYGPGELIAVSLVQGVADYLRDPWTAAELLARLEHRLPLWPLGGVAGFRISSPGPRTRLEIDDLTVPQSRLLAVLLRHQDQVVPRDALFYSIWGRPGGRSRTVDVHISALRKKIARAGGLGNCCSIRCEQGKGYRLTIVNPPVDKL